jgi:hypothetical protein
MRFIDFLATVTDEERDFVAGLDHGQDRAGHRKALDVAIANGGVVDTATQGVWFPMEVVELGRNALSKGHEREYALCVGIVLQTGRIGDEIDDMVENHAADIAALPESLKLMLQEMIMERMTGCEQQAGGYSPPAARSSKPTP